MAIEKQVGVVVDVKGKDNLSPILDAQKRKAEELQQTMAKQRQAVGAGVPPMPSMELPGATAPAPAPARTPPPVSLPFQSDEVREARLDARNRARAEATGTPFQSERVRALRE